MRRDPGHYDYLPYHRRPKIVWPGGARVALWVAPNVEFYELNPPANPARGAWPRPLPDVLAYSYRDYGNRVGFRRMLEAMDACGVRGSVSLNVAVCEHHPEIIAECAKRGWEFYSHGIYNTRYVFGMDAEQERAVIRDSRATIAQHTGQTLDGWLAPALTYTENTIELIAEEGLSYTCDLFHDDQPTPLTTRAGRLVSIPYSLDMNDTIAFYVNEITPREYGGIIRAQFDQLWQEGARSGTVMCIPLHPYQVGHPHRMAAFAEALKYIANHDGVWLATGREIARHFIDRHFDAFVDAARAYKVAS